MRLAVVSLCLAPLLVVASPGQERVGRRDEDDFDIGKATRRRALGSIVVLGSYLYLEGGEHSSYFNGEKPSSFLDSYRTNNTLAISLSESWNNMTSEYIHTTKDDPRPVNSLALWADTTENVLYRWGGELADDGTFGRDDAALWKFSPNDDGTGEWSKENSGDGFGSILQGANGTRATCGQKAFYLGGYGSASTDYRLGDLKSGTGVPPLPGLLTYDMADGTWTNDTAVMASAPNGVHINGRAVCPSDFNNDGIVVLVGGMSTSPSSVSDDIQMSSMRNISFFDTSDGTWHWQTAKGEVPRPRQHHCTVGVQGRNGTYEIFMYGGHSPSDGTFGDVYILSLPAFEWFLVEVDSPPRMFHDCAVIGNRQMISNGGLEDVSDWQTPDPWFAGVGIFDMTELMWSDGYDSIAAAYDSPQVVKDWYDNGGLSTVSWSTNRASQIFGNGEIVDPSANPGDRSDPIGEDGNDDGADNRTGGSSTPVAAIAGGVVGGVAFLALLGVLFYFWRRRRGQASGEVHEKDATGGRGQTAESQSELAATPLSMDTSNKPPNQVDPRSPPTEMSTDPSHSELPQFNELPRVRHEMQG